MPLNLDDGFENLRDVRDRVEITLTNPINLLGTYSYTDASNTPVSDPAIYTVRNPTTDPPRNWEKSGLECLIFPARSSGRALFNGAAQFTNVYNIRLIQHDRSKDTNAAYRALLKVFNDIQYQSLLAQDDERDEQLNLALFDSDLIN